MNILEGFEIQHSFMTIESRIWDLVYEKFYMVITVRTAWSFCFSVLEAGKVNVFSSSRKAFGQGMNAVLSKTNINILHSYTPRDNDNFSYLPGIKSDDWE